MLKARREAADQIATKLFRAEAAVSEAVRHVAALVGEVETSRTSAKLALMVGSDGGQRTINCLTALGMAKQELVQAHAEFDRTRKQIGLGAVLFGDGGSQKPSDDALTTALAVVAA